MHSEMVKPWGNCAYKQETVYPAYEARVVLRPANLYSSADLARMWSVAYADYFVNLQFDERRLDSHVHIHDIDLARSVVLEADDGDFIGLSLLGVRGARGWIGGFGIAPSHRGQGYSAILIRSQLAVARGAGLGSVQLEVLMQNWASKTYERAGFNQIRQLFVVKGRVENAERAPGAELVSPRIALQHIQRLRCGQIWPWQREFETVTRALTATSVGITITTADGTSGALVCDREENGSVRILDIGGSAASVGPMLAVVRDLFDDRETSLVNEPADSDLHPWLLAAGLKPMWIQREMMLHFDLAPEI
jgi:GNAT superfamily N-acetyltransferase